MKNITDLLARGNLTPRERFLLLIHNDLQRSKTGKDVLTAADKQALEDWQATTNAEVREWNQLSDGWRLAARLIIEAELQFNVAQAAHLSHLPVIFSLLSYPAERRAALCLKNLQQIKKVTIEQAVEIARLQKEIKLQEGLDFDSAVYKFAFELLSPEDRNRLLELYADIEFDQQYLDQEEVIANLFGDGKELTAAAKDRLAELVADQAYNRYAKEYQLFHYFAGIPLTEVARRFLNEHHIEIPGRPLPQNQETEDGDDHIYEATSRAMRQYAAENSVSIRAMLRESCRAWLDQDLLACYKPLIISDDADLLQRWFTAKAQAREKLLAHVAAGEFTLRERTAAENRKQKLWSKNIYDSEFAAAQKFLEDLRLKAPVQDELAEKKAFATFSDSVITGASLCAFKSDYKFAADFKKRADTYNPNLGLVYAEDDPEHKGEHLDRELLICELTDSGEASYFSQYGLSVAMLSNLLASQTLFEEYQKNGQSWLRFKDAELAEAFVDRRQVLSDGYARLLGFIEILKKLSGTYETDMAAEVSGRLADLRENIERHNLAIRTATNTNTETPRKSSAWLNEAEPRPFQDELLIDISAIEPDREIMEEWGMKMKEVFPDIY